jgi:manganese/zinc/iron transport system permease protein
MTDLLRNLVNPFVWFTGPPPAEWGNAGLETFWPIVVQGTLVSLALAIVGCFLVVRGMALLGDALAHSVLPGIVIGFLIGGSMTSPWILVGATLMGLAATVLIEAVHRQSRVKEDASLGVVFTALFALGVVMISTLARQVDLDPRCVLYGELEYFVLRRDHIWPMAFILAVLLALLAAFYRQILVVTFDPLLARSVGVRAGVVHYGMMTALALTTVASFEAVGAILVVALLIMPGATARMWTDRIPAMLLVACVHAIASTLLGYWASHPAVLDTSASAAITTAGFAFFLLSWLFAPRHGLLHRRSVRRRLERAVVADHVVKLIGETGAPLPAAEIARALHLEPRRMRVAMAEATRRGHVRVDAGSVRLTDLGHAAAARLAAAHELWEAYLQKQLGLPADHVHDAAEWVEHHLDDVTLDEIRRQVVS